MDIGSVAHSEAASADMVSDEMLAACFSGSILSSLRRYGTARRVVAYIVTHHHECVTLDELAVHVGMERTSLSRFLSRTVGVAFTQLRRAIRIARAIELLRRSDHSIAEIAYAVGFSDPAVFCRTFKMSTGRSPSVFRKELSPSWRPVLPELQT